jgi:hypothetical protein
MASKPKGGSGEHPSVKEFLENLERFEKEISSHPPERKSAPTVEPVTELDELGRPLPREEPDTGKIRRPPPLPREEPPEPTPRQPPAVPRPTPKKP